MNVDFLFYKDVMKKDKITDEATFNKYLDDNLAFVKNLSGDELIIERESDGLKKAVCVMCEKDYEHDTLINGNASAENTNAGSGNIASESIGGYSVSYDTSRRNKAIELNEKSIEHKKFRVLRKYCYVTNGKR